MNDCLFCKIANNIIPTQKLYEDNQTLAFHDIDQQAPVHIIVIPKKHYETVHDIPNSDMNIMTDIFKTVNKIVKQENLKDNGYRLVINSGKHGGQEIPHIHIHILSGRDMQWPPG